MTQNDLAGSKRLFNFFDSAFGIARSAKDESMRYVKQLKARSCEIRYGSENIILYSVEKVSDFLQFVPVGYSREAEHLRQPGDNDRADLIAEVKRMAAEGCSQRKIAEELKISVGSVNNYLKQ